MLVLPEAEVLRADAALGRYGRGFGENESGATDCAAAEMDPNASRSRSRLPEEYSHMGETTMRLGKVMPASLSGEKRVES